jgi:hypothetical protein
MLTDDELDHVCWLVHSSRERQGDLAAEGGDRALYHGGGADSYDDVAGLLEGYEVDVAERAERYAGRKDVKPIPGQ